MARKGFHSPYEKCKRYKEIINNPEIELLSQLMTLPLANVASHAKNGVVRTQIVHGGLNKANNDNMISICNDCYHSMNFVDALSVKSIHI